MVNLQIESVKLDKLKQYPGNARRGNVDALKDSLTANGQFKPLVVQKATGYILAGNNTYKAAKALKWADIQVVYVDVDDDEARRINLADNRTSDLATYDIQALAELLDGIDEFAGTGYTIEDLDDLVASIQEVEQNHAAFNAVSDTAPTNGDAQSNMSNYGSLSELAERYTNKTTRVLMADYSNNRFVWLIDKLGEIRKANGLDSNAAAIVAAVEYVSGEAAPQD